MFSDIGDLLPRLHVYESLFPQHDRLIQCLSSIYCDLLQFCYDAKAVLRKPKRLMFSTAWKSFDRQFGRLLVNFKRHQEQVEKEVQASHLIESADSRSIVMFNKLQVAEEKKRKTSRPAHAA